MGTLVSVEDVGKGQWKSPQRSAQGPDAVTVGQTVNIDPKKIPF